MNKSKYSLVFTVFLFILFVCLAWQASHFGELARFFPLYISIGGAVLTLAEVVVQLRRVIKESKDHVETVHDSPWLVLKYLFWVLGYLGVIYIVGFIIGTAVYLLTFLYFETKFSIVKSAFGAAVAVSLLLLFGEVMTLYWPEGMLGRALGW